jgi:hypothetical protein
MAAHVLHVGATVLCPHGGSVTIQSSNSTVKVSNQSVATASDTFTISGCPFQVPIGTGTKPQPCVTLRWVTPAARVRVNGQPVILKTSSGICQSAEQIPQGPPNVTITQMRVKGT